MWRPFWLIVPALAITGCTTQHLPAFAAFPQAAAAAADAPIDVFPESQSAFFSTFPDALLAAVARSCVDPGQTVRRSGARAVMCESLPSPEGAAALILAHNGTVTDIPRLFTSIVAVPSGAGFMVSGDTYIAVPQRTGGIVHIRLPDADASMRNLLRDAGGVFTD